MLDLSATPPHPLVCASILSADFGRMADECRDVLGRGADLLHIDVMDGHFVSNLTMGADMIRALRRHFPQTCLDVHVMAVRPGEYVESFADAGADVFSFHLEVSWPFHPNGVDAAALIERIHTAGMKAGMVLNPYTPAQPLEPHLANLDVVLLMSVVPGRSGQSFMPHVLDKAKWIKPRLSPKTRLEVDGGVNPDTAPQAAAAGCDMLVTASALFGAVGEERAAVIEALHTAR